MATVLIVEDEYLVRVGLRTCIDWEQHGFALLEDATNGVDAYERICKYCPDILLLDIKMPRMDGFELLRRLNEEGIRPCTIILSCCNDFDSVRTALQYGVIDDLDKLTLNASELLRVLGEVPKTQTTPPQSPNAPVQEEAVPPQAVLEKLAAGTSCTPQELGVLFPRGHVAYLMVTRKNQAQLPSATLIQNMITQQLIGCGISCVSCVEQSGAIVLLLPEEKHIDSLMQRICQRLNSVLDAWCAMGLSGCYPSPREIPQQLQWARQIRHCLYWDKPDWFAVFHGPEALGQEQESQFRALRERAHNSLLAHSREDTLECVGAFIQAFSQSSTLNPDDYIHLCLSMLKLFSLEALEDSYFASQQAIMKSQTAAQANQALQSFASQSLDASALFGSGQYSPIVKAVIQYVISNPQRIIQLSEAAQHANISESYLSQLFKKETGENYISFVHRYKINLAKEMLEGSSLVYEVCDQIGFENANYFSKIFRRYTGHTPSSYKKQMQKKDRGGLRSRDLL